MLFKKSSSLKYRAIIFVISTLIVTEFLISYLIYQKEKNNLLNIHKKEFLNIEYSYNSVLINITNFYKNRLLTLLKDERIVNAIQNRDREKLLKLTEDKWELLKKENSSLSVMQYHSSDGRSILRMHDKNSYNDNIVNKRASLQEIHQNHRFLAGFEDGKFFSLYRIIVPVFKNKEYIGAIEYGIKVDLILKKLKSLIGVNGYMFKHLENHKVDRLDQHTIEFSTDKDSHFIKYLESLNYIFGERSEVVHNKRSYLLHHIELFDFSGNSAIHTLIVKDVTNDLLELKELFIYLLIVVLSVTSFIAILVIYGLNKLMGRIEILMIELETIFDKSKDGIAVLDLDMNFLSANSEYLSMTGFLNRDILKQNCRDLTIEEDREQFDKAVAELFKTGSAINIIKGCRDNRGNTIYVNISLTLMPDKVRILATTKNITELRKNEKIIENYLKLIDENILSTKETQNGLIISASSAFLKLTGYKIDEVLNKKLLSIHSDNFTNEQYIKILDSVHNNGMWRGELEYKDIKGKPFWCDTAIYPNFDEQGNLSGYTTIRHDITDKKIVEELSIKDPLTELYNRRHFNRVIEVELNRAKREPYYISFMIFDVDYFKKYNDTYGHQAGDIALKKVGQIVKESTKRVSDFAFRVGGEEFGVIFSNMDLEKSREFADIIRESIESLKIEHKESGASKYLTISAGIAVSKSQETTSELLYKVADQALYKAKEFGRNRVEVLIIN